MNNNETLYTIHSEWHDHMGDWIRDENLYFKDMDDAWNKYTELRESIDVPYGTSVIVRYCDDASISDKNPLGVKYCFTRRWEETKGVDW